ncbi:DNA recombination protein RmuC [Spelaeicoccus albus]|uniref:DNA recombination protein RmuC n=1 Tax=Spelaeicoccus albus TaxID=1280376 RepID=A0A7Z0D381_9MICO|nr:DNA recombination protein RmuC [Spelaeicoccus albus]NYI68020.1 DNA recombination protein RmuC [Spelaeicoccus albus]
MTSLVVTAIVALLIGAILGFAVAAVLARTRRIAVETERTMLARRVDDLEADAGFTTEIAGALGPLAQSMRRVERQVDTLERDRTEQYARLDTQLAQVAASGEALRTTTEQLSGALRASSSRGSWGEVQLRRVVEHAGMLERVDFDVQTTARTPDGATVRPDLVVRLPGRKQLVVDAKAPLAAFLRASESPGTVDSAQLAEHARALRSHVDTLAAKEYWAAFTPSPDLVVCFIPGESFLAAACQADATLMEYAMAKKVVLATPGTLLALLRTVALTWQHDALNGSAKELFTVGRELYDRLGTMSSHLSKMGGSLTRAVEDYNRLIGTMESRVFVSARRLKDLDLSDAPIDPVDPLSAATRGLGAPELLDAAFEREADRANNDRSA